jgi:hypothetical protein
MFRTRLTVALTTAALTLTGVAFSSSVSAEPRVTGDIDASAVEKRHTKRHTLLEKRHTKRHTFAKRHTKRHT